MSIWDQNYFKKLEQDALKKILQRRKDKRNGIRKFDSKEDEHETMAREAMECIESVFENNKYYYDKEIKCTYFKYTESDILEINSFFENANESLDFVKHSPVWEKHQNWMDFAIINNQRKPLESKKYRFKG